jgi:SNF2 family DNA or RNA helicase
MIVRRVRLLAPEAVPAPRGIDPSLAVPAPKRARVRFGRVRVRSVWLKGADSEVRTRWASGVERPEESRRDPRTTSRSRPAAEGETPEAGFLDRLRELLRPSFQAVLRREEWPRPLFPFQETGAVFLYERKAALLADEQGLGKTVQALAAAGLLLATGEIRQFLVLCPASLVSHWAREVGAWLPRLRTQVTVVNGPPRVRVREWHSRAPILIAGYETFRADFLAGRLPERSRDLVILDEAQRIKNADTDLAVACKTVPRARSWALTGTPLENRLEELYSILEWLTGEPLSGLSGRAALPELQRRLQLRRRKEAVAQELPAKTVVDVSLELGAAQRGSYRELERTGLLRLKQQGESLRVTHVLALLTRLKQVCNFCPRTGESAKLDFLRPQIAEILASGRQALVFSQFADERAGVRRLAAELGAAAAAFDGSLSFSARDTMVRRFTAAEIPVLAISLKAGGVGLNLQNASYVFHFDRWWNPAAEWQAEDRAHRIGQALPVTVYRLTCAGTLEERIHAILKAKEGLFQQVVDGAPVPVASRWSVADLFSLVDLSVPPHLQSTADRPLAEPEE